MRMMMAMMVVMMETFVRRIQRRRGRHGCRGHETRRSAAVTSAVVETSARGIPPFFGNFQGTSTVGSGVAQLALTGAVLQLEWRGIFRFFSVTVVDLAGAVVVILVFLVAIVVFIFFFIIIE